MTFNYALTDVNYENAQNSYRGISFSPEKRGVQEQESYFSDMKNAAAALTAVAATDEQKTVAVAQFEKYKAAYLRLNNARLSALSRCLSVMITGGSNFPHRRNEKANNVEHKRLSEFVEWHKKALPAAVAAVKKLSNDSQDRRAIRGGDSDALQALEAKIQSLTEWQEFMKRVNKVRPKTETEFYAIQGANADRYKDFLGGIRFSGADYKYPAYKLTNNNATIRVTKERLESLTAKKQAGNSEAERESGIKIIENVEADRLQLIFPNIPAAEIRSDLKKNGFRWSPTNGAWQSYLNSNQRLRAADILKKHNL